MTTTLNTIVLSQALPAGTYTLSPVGAVVTPPPPSPPPAVGTLLIFHNGVMDDTQGEYDFGSGTVQDSALSPDVPGLKVILVTGDEGLQIRMPGDDLNSAPFGANGYVSVTCKAKLPNTTITTGAEEIGDVTIPNTHGMFNIAPYAIPSSPTDPAGFTTYHIPLSAYGIVNGLHVYKFAFLGNTTAPGGNAANQIEYSDFVIVPAS